MSDLPGNISSGDDLRYESGIMSSKIPTTITFACCFLLFLLPFLQIANGPGSNQTITGFQLVTGYIAKIPAIQEGDNNVSTSQIIINEQIEPSVYAIIAFGLAIMGCFLSWVNARPDGIGSLLAGLLAFAALVCLWFNPGNDITTGLVEADDGRADSDTLFTPWYYLSAVFLLLASYFSYKRIVLNR